MRVAVLFARSDSVYKRLRGVDVFDKERDARTWPGGTPVIAHPPCAQWSRLRAFAHSKPEEKALAVWAVDQVRMWGGVLEHPASSTLWAHAGLPRPGAGKDAYCGWTLPVLQYWWGHPAAKLTWLYIVGLDYPELPSVPLKTGIPERVVSKSCKLSGAPELSKSRREKTPVAFARWLRDVAMRIQEARAA